MENVINFILDLFVSNGIIIAVAAFVMGKILKPIKQINSNIIPLCGGLLGIILGVVIPNVFDGKDPVTSAIMGLALGWAATGGYETLRNLKNGGEK